MLPVASLVVAAAVGVASIAPVAADDGLRDKHRKVQRQITVAKRDYVESSGRLRRATTRLDSAKTDLADARADLADARTRVQAARLRDQRLQDRLDRAEGRLADARHDLAAGRSQVADQRGEVEGTVVGFYETGDPDLLAVSSILQADDLADLTRREHTQDTIVVAQDDGYTSLQASEVLLTVRRDQVSDAKADVADRRDAAADHLETMETLESEKESAKADVADKVAARRDAQADARRARRADRAELRRLRREDARIRRILARRARAAGADATSSAPSGGYLLHPVAGPITSPFGLRIHPIYGYRSLHDGDDFGAACGTPIRAAAPGTVLSSYYQTAYGNRLIIDHGLVAGAGLATIYNHATRYTVGVGEHVDRGEIIGYVGTTGWSTGCHLHFTVMVNGQPVDPTGWF